MYNTERQLPAKFQSFSHPPLLLPRDGAPIVPRLYSPRWRWSAASSPPPPVLSAQALVCVQRNVLMSICAEDAEASHLPPDVRRRVTALPGLMDRLYAVLSVLAPADGAHKSMERFGLEVGGGLAEEMAETALELTMIARMHLIAFYARIRPARTGSVHRAAAAMLRHRPLNVSPTTLTSGISGQDLRALEAAGWLEARDEETAHGHAHRFTPSNEFMTLDYLDLPRKRGSHPHPVDVLCDGVWLISPKT